MTSSRLPGKVLADLGGRPLLEQLLRRVAAMREVDAIVVATTALPSDDPVAELVGRLGFGVFRGDEQDVLSRFLGAARQARADVIVRLTADCPLLDPAESDRVVRALVDDGEADYASNVDPRTYPVGLDTEALFRDTLERVGRLARSPEAREHVTWLIYRERPELFLRRSVTDREDNSDLRWTVDTPDDLAAVGRLYGELGLGERALPFREILAYARAHPEIGRLNAHVAQRRA